MINYDKRFKHVHAYESNISCSDLNIENNIIKFEKDISINIRVYQKNFFYEIYSGSTFSFKKPENQKYWLYVFLDSEAELKVGTTVINPFKFLFGDMFPSNPKSSQLFFNKSISRMFEWNGKGWIEKDAVIIAYFNENDECLDLYNRVSQGGFRPSPFLAERIVKDDQDNFIKLYEKGSYSFLTYKEADMLGFTLLKNIELKTLIHRSTAKSSMDSMTVVKRDENYDVSPCTTLSENNGVALLINDVEEGQECLLLEKGFYLSSDRQWPDDVNSPLFYDENGTLTAVSPSFNNSLAVQRVGRVVDINTIYFSPEEKFILSNT